MTDNIESLENQQEVQSNKAKGQYWWGLLGLIPLLGSIVGVILLLLGIFRYKDKVLVLIGAGGILFTVGIYSSLFYQIKNGPSVATGFATIAQMQINSLVKDIEFYKMQHGEYPAKLEDIQENGKVVSIVDPILLSNSAKGNLNYRYEKIGHRYKIYSVGVDGIDNTTDDLYPILLNSDTTKIGFIGK